MSKTATVSHNKGWSSSTTVKYKDPPPLRDSITDSHTHSSSPRSDYHPPTQAKLKPTMLQRFASFGRISSHDDYKGEDQVTGSKLFAAAIKFMIVKDPFAPDVISRMKSTHTADTESNNNNVPKVEKPNGSISKVAVEVSVSKSEDVTVESEAEASVDKNMKTQTPTQTPTQNPSQNPTPAAELQPKSNDDEKKLTDPPILNSVVSVYHHKAAKCYEVVTYDITSKKELNRLYVPADKVADIAKTKRLSFIGSQDPAENLSKKFSRLMSFTHDSEKGAPRAHILGADTEKPGRKQSISIPKPAFLNAMKIEPPTFSQDGTLAPVRKASILETVGRRFSIFGNNKPAKVLNMDQHHQQQQIINNKPVLRKPASLQTPYDTIPENKTRDICGSEEESSDSKQFTGEIPRQLSSNRLMGAIGYDKSVDTMLSEAAQMRLDLAAKREAKKLAEAEKSKKKKRSY